MFAKKKDTKRNRPERSAESLEQYGIFQIPESLGDISGGLNPSDDEDLEAELAALTTNNDTLRSGQRAAPKNPVRDLDTVINVDSKGSVSDEEDSIDDDDPELLNELSRITGETDEIVYEVKNVSQPVGEDAIAVNETIKLLTDRLSIYNLAEKKARDTNDNSRARRFGRGIKTLEHLLASARAGNIIDPSEIPPVLPSSAFETTDDSKFDETNGEEITTLVTPSVSQSVNNLESIENENTSKEVEEIHVDNEKLRLLTNRQKEYKLAALSWKKSGNIKEAVELLKVVKQFDAILKLVTEGQDFDISNMPPPPTFPSNDITGESTDCKEENEYQKQSNSNPVVNDNLGSNSLSQDSLELVLRERLEVYRRSKTVAESEGNSSKIRRYARICKQFEDALKLLAKNKPVPLEELPTPPGFPPLISSNNASVPQDQTSNAISGNASAVSQPQETESNEPSNDGNENVVKNTPTPPARRNSDKKKLTSRADKQAQLLQQRQLELKMAALKAKKDGDLDLAKDYLRQAKGIDPLINASLSGLPVDMKSIPLSPAAKAQLDAQNKSPLSAADGFTLISALDCTEEASGTDQQIYENLEAQLTKQIKHCLSTRDHCKVIGDVSSYNKWSRLALDYTKDLDMLRVRKRNALPPPQHHYEVKTYSILQCCTDLTDADLEINIIRGINYPKEADTYVIFELPYPNDNHTTDRTATIRENLNPEYNATFPLNGLIDRKSRPCLRTFKRHSLKCQVWSKGGFFRSDSLIGTANIKLQPLETKCVLHDSFPLMDGRKATGGKLEVKLRLRNPILTKQIEQSKDKWLEIDH